MVTKIQGKLCKVDAVCACVRAHGCAGMRVLPGSAAAALRGWLQVKAPQYCTGHAEGLGGA